MTQLHNTQDAIKQAIEGGYSPEVLIGKKYPNEGAMARTWNEEKVEAQTLLDPLFWESLGKARGWERSEKIGRKQVEVILGRNDWRIVWHRFIDHLADGRKADEFFAELS